MVEAVTKVPNLPDRYKILGTLGSGGMGTVYKVHDNILDTIVALKVLHVTDGSSDDRIMRFNQEARACARLHHPNIIGILDFGLFENITPYMVLEYVDGKTLKEHISKVGRLSPQEAIHVFDQLISALSHAHSQKIIHRDLKSSNVLITKNNGDQLSVKLFDFGIARIKEDVEAMRLTSTNSLIGTPTYMSPEQINNQAIDARSDIYSLGCVMFEALTRKLPFSSPDMMALLELQLNAEAPKIGSIVPSLRGSSLETTVDRCLQKDPVDRYQSASEIAKDLGAETSNETSSIQTTNETKKVSNGKRLAIVGAIGTPLVLIASYLLYSTQQNDQSEKPEAKTHEAPPMVSLNEKIAIRKSALEKGINPNEKSELKLSRVANFEDEDIRQIPNDGKITQIDVSGPSYPADRRESQGYELDDLGYRYIAKITRLKGVKVNYVMPISRAAIQSLSKLKHLERLDAKDSTFEDANSLSQLRHLSCFSGSRLSAKQVSTLEKLPIQKLALHSIDLDEPMIKVICSLRKIERLDLDRCTNVDGLALAQLSALPELYYVALNVSPGVAKNGILPLTTLKHVKFLNLTNDGLNDNHAEQLSKMIWLKDLNLEGDTDMTDKALNYFSKMPAFKKPSHEELSSNKAYARRI